MADYRSNKRRRIMRRTTIIEEIFDPSIYSDISSQLQDELSSSCISEEKSLFEEESLIEELSLDSLWQEDSQDSFIMREINRGNSNDSYICESDYDTSVDFDYDTSVDFDYDTSVDFDYDTSVDFDFGETFQEEEDLDESKILVGHKRKRGKTPIYILGFLHEMIRDFGTTSTLREHLQHAVENQHFDIEFDINEWSRVCHYKDKCDRCCRKRTLSCGVALGNRYYNIGCDCIRYVELIRHIFSELNEGHNPDPAEYYLALDEIRQDIDTKYARK